MRNDRQVGASCPRGASCVAPWRASEVPWWASVVPSTMYQEPDVAGGDGGSSCRLLTELSTPPQISESFDGSLKDFESTSTSVT